MSRAAAAVAAAALVAAGPAAPAAGAERDTPVPVLVYHHVARAPATARNPALYVPPRLFARHVAALHRAGYTAVTLGRAWRHWNEGAALPPKPVVLSFDDGYRDQYRNAARTLRARRWPGVLNLWVERLGAPGGLSRAEVQRMLRDGWEVGAHSMTHADLTTVAPEDLEQEVAGSRAALRRAFPGEPVDFFCYPYGRFAPAVEAAVRAAGFLGATTTRRGAAEPRDGPYALDRIVVTGSFSPGRVLRAIRATSSRR
ncbi:MAG TPA: polysaccharide deacetylase family protein [Solirubrobacteraceae bacterium]|nr:polysaccharide deacetylase family protein [Solirubrobacteraceae bacterium]